MSSNQQPKTSNRIQATDEPCIVTMQEIIISDSLFLRM